MSLLDRILGRDPRRTTVDGPLDCRAVGRVLQSVLDAETEAEVAERVAEHLEACRDCGLEADTYLHIKSALATDEALDRDAARRLRAFGTALATGTVGPGGSDVGDEAE